MDNSTRQLAAIMFTDIEGYTALMQNNEPEALMKKNRYIEVLENFISESNGKIIKTFGDGALCIFKSALNAVTCAVKVQTELQSEPVVPLRAGIHIGDISFDGDDIFGDSVNLASRLESISTGGAVLISGKVYDDIKNQPSFPAISLGKFEFKNVNYPVEVFAINTAGLRIPQPGEMKGKVKQSVRTIAVLPFVNMSNDPENEYFSDGITEEILNALTKVNGLEVISRTSSFSFKGKNENVKEIGTKLNASSVIEGSVRKSGNRVRITVQLINALDGIHFWSEVYDRELNDIFALQDEISLAIARKFELDTGNVQSPGSLVGKETDNLDAYDLFLKGAHLMHNNTDAHKMFEAMKLFEEALKLDDRFIKAYTSLVSCYCAAGVWGIIHPETSYPKAKEYSDKALKLNENDEETNISAANYKLLFEWDFDGAYKYIKRAIEINPNNASARGALYHYLKALGKFDEALIQAEKEAALDPLNVKAHVDLAYAYIDTGEFGRAYTSLKKALEISPMATNALYALAQLYIVTGDSRRAIDEMEKWDQKLDGWFKDKTLIPIAYAKTGNPEFANEYIERAMKQAEENKSRSFSIPLASMYCALKDFDNAFKYVEEAIREKVGAIVMIKSFIPLLDLKGDNRFKEILKKIGLEQ